MDPWHRLLLRQLKRCGGSLTSPPAKWDSFVRAVNDAYDQSDEDRQLLERSLELSSQELYQANREMRKDLKKIQILYDLAVAMAGGGDLSENLLLAVDKCREMFEADAAFIGLKNPGEDHLTFWALSGIRSRAFAALKAPIDSGVSGKVLGDRRGIIIEDYFARCDIKRFNDDAIVEEGLVSGMAAPIQSGETAEQGIG